MKAGEEARAAQSVGAEGGRPFAAGGTGAAGLPHVLFGLSGRSFAVEAPLCKGVLRTPALSRLPGAPPWVLGVVAFRGEVVSLTDPACFLRLGRDPAAAPAYVLMLTCGDARVGLGVDRVVDVVSIPVPRALDAEPPWPGCPEGLLKGQVPGGSDPVFILDAVRYAESTGPGAPWRGREGAGGRPA